MLAFANTSLDPVNVITWLLVGLVAGWLAGVAVRGSGFGVLGDIVVGLIGAVIGGFLLGLFIPGGYGLLGTIVVAFLGACILIGVVRLAAPRGYRR